MKILLLLKSSLEKIIKKPTEFKTFSRLNDVKRALYLGLLAAISFMIYSLVRDYEVVRVKFGDFEYDIMQEIYAKFPSSSQNPKIAVILINQEYLDKHNLSDGQGGIKFNFTPRSVLSNVLDDLNKTLAEAKSKPTALLLDYALDYPSDINGTANPDDIGLISRLNSYALSYPIYLPKAKNKLFLEDFNLNENIKFAQTSVASDKDGIARGYTPYICDGDKVLRHLALELSQSEVKFDCPKEPSFEESFKHRILYKELKIVDQGSGKTYVSNYENIKFYPAARLSQIDGEEFENALILIGSDYPGSGDMHKTPIGMISGVIVLANAINTAFTLKDGFSVMSIAWGTIYYFAFFSLGIYFTIKTARKLNLESKNFNILRLCSIAIFFIPAVFLFFRGFYVTWIVPLVVFELLDMSSNTLRVNDFLKKFGKISAVVTMLVVVLLAALFLLGGFLGLI